MTWRRCCGWPGRTRLAWTVTWPSMVCWSRRGRRIIRCTTPVQRSEWPGICSGRGQYGERLDCVYLRLLRGQRPGWGSPSRWPLSSSPGSGEAVSAQPWLLSYRADPRALRLADRHYNRQKVGSAQFVPPGRCLVLLTEAADALWVTSYPLAEYVQHAWAGAL